jgi:hypothetical protein
MEKIAKKQKSVDAFPAFRLQTAFRTQIQTPLHHRSGKRNPLRNPHPPAVASAKAGFLIYVF